MNTVSYIERKKYVRYDTDSYLLYLNEAPPAWWTRKAAKPSAARLIGRRYSIDDQIAILANSDNRMNTPRNCARLKPTAPNASGRWTNC